MESRIIVLFIPQTTPSPFSNLILTPGVWGNGAQNDLYLEPFEYTTFKSY